MVTKAEKEYRDKLRKNRPPEQCGNQRSDCQRTFWIAELFVPQPIWDQISLCERITTEGIDAVLSDDGEDLRKVITELAALLMSVIHKGDDRGDDND